MRLTKLLIAVLIACGCIFGYGYLKNIFVEDLFTNITWFAFGAVYSFLVMERKE